MLCSAVVRYGTAQNMQSNNDHNMVYKITCCNFCFIQVRNGVLCALHAHTTYPHVTAAAPNCSSRQRVKHPSIIDMVYC